MPRSLNKIIQNSQLKKNVSLEEQKAQKEDRLLRGRQIALMIHDNFRMTGAHDEVLDDADLLSVPLRDDIVEEFDTRWDEVLLSMSKFTFQLQQMQKQMNSMNDSGAFQDVKSNYSGRLSHVSSKPAMIPSSRALLCRDKRLPLDTRNQSRLPENVFWKAIFYV